MVRSRVPRLSWEERIARPAATCPDQTKSSPKAKGNPFDHSHAGVPAAHVCPKNRSVGGKRLMGKGAAAVVTIATALPPSLVGSNSSPLLAASAEQSHDRLWISPSHTPRTSVNRLGVTPSA